MIRIEPSCCSDGRDRCHASNAPCNSTRNCSPACSSRLPSRSTSFFRASRSALAAFIATLLVRWIATGQDHLHRLARFWTKIFAVSFAMGVVSGMVLSYQFGTNWSRFSVVVGNVIGPMIGYEVLMAFFLEATFLGVMLFGWQRVPPWLHVMAAICVAVGTAMSAFWILSANSWMQTPAGHEVRDGIAYPLDWLTVIFNPSFFYRLPHMLTAAYLDDVAGRALGRRALRPAGDATRPKRAPCCTWASECWRSLARCRSSSATSTGSIRSSTSRPRSRPSRRIGTVLNPGELVLFAWPDAKTETNLLRDRDSARRVADPHPPFRRPLSRAQRLPAAPIGRRWFRRSSRSASWSGSASS